MFAALAALTMKTIMTSHWRPLAGLSGLFTPNRKPAKSEMSVELRMIPMLLTRKTHKKASKAAPFFVNSWCSTS